jgi:hypothetical protein
MSFENSLWGATKIHGELLKLGIAVAQSTVSVYMVPRRDRPLQTWKTFLRNHLEGIASIDLSVVPTIAFQQLFAFLVLCHKRRCGWTVRDQLAKIHLQIGGGPYISERTAVRLGGDSSIQNNSDLPH